MTSTKTLVQLCGIALLSASPLAAVAFTAQSAQAFSFTRTYVFGDSISDNGNLFNATLGLAPPSPPYAQRLSNGPVWVEYLAPRLGTSLIDFAFAGASTDGSNTTVPFFPGVKTQIDGFTAANPVVDPGALYILFAGANDYLGGGQTDPTKPVSNLKNEILSLVGVGAKNILVANLPDLGQLPGTRGNPLVSQGLSSLSGAHDALLAQTVGSLQTTLGSSVNLVPLDIQSLFADAIANPAKYGFTNVTDSCLFPPASICSNPDQYLFWDDIHPTTVGHERIADFAFATLESNAVPEPSATLGLLAAGALLGGAAVIKRQRRQKVKLFAESIALAKTSR